jgi:hypothetical protein
MTVTTAVLLLVLAGILAAGAHLVAPNPWQWAATALWVATVAYLIYVITGLRQ